MLSNLTEIAKALSGFLAPVVALVALWIAYCQHKTAQDKVRLDLYERRFRVYRAAKKISWLVRADKLTSEVCSRFYQEKAEAPFLFDDDINKHLTDIIRNARGILAQTKMLADDSVYASQTVEEARKKRNALYEWFVAEHDFAPNRFRKYLDFRTTL